MKAKLTGSMPGIKVRYTKIIKEELLEVMMKTAKSFVHGASTRTPRFTGQARGSLWPLANTVRTNLKRSEVPSKSLDAGRKPPRNQSVASGRALQDHYVKWNEFYWESYVKYYGRHDRSTIKGGQGWRAKETGYDWAIKRFEEAILEADLPEKILESYGIN